MNTTEARTALHALIDAMPAKRVQALLRLLDAPAAPPEARDRASYHQDYWQRADVKERRKQRERNATPEQLAKRQERLARYRERLKANPERLAASKARHAARQKERRQEQKRARRAASRTAARG